MIRAYLNEILNLNRGNCSLIPSLNQRPHRGTFNIRVEVTYTFRGTNYLCVRLVVHTVSCRQRNDIPRRPGTPICELSDFITVQPVP